MFYKISIFKLKRQKKKKKSTDGGILSWVGGNEVKKACFKHTSSLQTIIKVFTVH